jgi:hypothetical protein
MTLDEQIRAIVREELQRSAPTTAKSLYSSKQLPPDVSAPATFNRTCRAGLVLGAEKHGRSWVCTVEAWSAYRRTASRQRRPAPAKAPVDDLLSQMGGRRVA